MQQVSKLMLSDEEQQLVNDTGWILTKRIIMDKVCALLVEASEKMQLFIENEKDWLPAEAGLSTPKIARGENYLQLPYMLLDYPRCFGAENVFTVRTMFWWGNFFSVTLQLSGVYKTMFQQKIIHHPDLQDYFICIHESQWHHHFEADNYIAVKMLSTVALAELISNKKFIKLALRFPLQPWQQIPELLDAAFAAMIKMLKA